MKHPFFNVTLVRKKYSFLFFPSFLLKQTTSFVDFLNGFHFYRHKMVV